MARPGVPLQASESWNDLGPKRVEVEVADQFEQVGLLVHRDGLVPVLAQMPHPLMAAIEGPRVAGEERAHTVGEGPGARPDEEMEMIRQERPSLDGPGAGLR
jgi:hypothetical protein